MSEGRSAATAHRVGAGAARVGRAWRKLPPERRLAAIAAILLFLSLFLPWYQRQFFVVVAGTPHPASDSQTGWAAFSFVEAAVLLVAAGVLVLLFQRAEGARLPCARRRRRRDHGGGPLDVRADRLADVRQAGRQQPRPDITSYGIEWGIFVALAVAGLLAYSGSRIRAAHAPEPPLPGERPIRAQRASSGQDPDEPPTERFPDEQLTMPFED